MSLIETMESSIHEVFAKLGLLITGGALTSAWIANVDTLLRIALSLVGVIAGSYSALYYREKYRAARLRNAKDL